MGFGLNEEALTFNRAAAVGEVGGNSPRGVAEEEAEALVPLVVGALAAGRGLAPLKGGMGCINILTDPFPVGFVASAEGLAEAGVLAGVAVLPGTTAGLIGACLAVVGCATTGRVALGVGLRIELVPMVRAWVELASLLAFSLICFCFSSSLARMGTKSSGMGLFSYSEGRSANRQVPTRHRSHK